MRKFLVGIINIDLASILLFLSVLFSSNQASACTRVVYHGLNETYITGRNMDWKTEIPANLWVLPRGVARTGNVGRSSIKWKSKYGSVVVSSWDMTSSDGMNEKGLVGNLLWLTGSEYPKYEKDQDKPGLVISLWLQYVLDNYETVAEATRALSKDNFVVVSSSVPETESYVTVHLSLSDKRGDSAIFEYINKKLVIHHDKSYVIMTNAPIYEEQIAINSYWKGISGTVMLPGTNRSADRFVRASFYINAVPKTDDIKIAVPTVFSVIRNVSVPYNISMPDQANISSTRWRAVADHKNLVYYFENVLNPNIIWLEFKNLDFSEQGRVRKLYLDNNENYSGESSRYLKIEKPFQFAMPQ